jgi:hypothetical protein
MGNHLRYRTKNATEGVGLVWCDASNRTLVEFVWDADGNWSYRMDIEYKIRIPNDNEELEPIKKLAPDEVVKEVGVIQAMDGNMEEQVKELEEKATLVMKQIQQGHLPW